MHKCSFIKPIIYSDFVSLTLDLTFDLVENLYSKVQSTIKITTPNRKDPAGTLASNLF